MVICPAALETLTRAASRIALRPASEKPVILMRFPHVSVFFLGISRGAQGEF